MTEYAEYAKVTTVFNNGMGAVFGLNEREEIIYRQLTSYSPVELLSNHGAWLLASVSRSVPELQKWEASNSVYVIKGESVTEKEVEEWVKRQA